MNIKQILLLVILVLLVQNVKINHLKSINRAVQHFATSVSTWEGSYIQCHKSYPITFDKFAINETTI
jgi:hypothetical protein